MSPAVRVDSAHPLRTRATRTGRFRAGLARFLLVGAIGCWAANPAALLAASDAAPESATGFSQKSDFVARRHVAVTAHPLATRTAVDILEGGGSAMDAALAAQLVLNVVEPQSSGIGGGGFLLHFDAASGRIDAFDGRETAPLAARGERFLDAEGRPRDFRSVVGTGAAVGVPGLVAMLEMAHRMHGRIPWRELFQPAIRLAGDGFSVSERLHRLIAADVLLPGRKDAAAVFLDSNGRAWPAGHRLRQPALAASLHVIAERGAEALYRGELGAAVVAAVADHGGDLTPADLANYRAVRRASVCGGYRGYRICGMPPPSSGAVTLLQLLGIVERTPFAAEPPLSPGAVHWFAEAGRLAYADRDWHLGDPDFLPMPLEALLGADYLASRAALLGADRSLGEAAAGQPPPKVSPGGTAAWSPGAAPELPATTHLSIVDANGNAVALTSSIENAFGTRIMAGGFLLNNQLTDFSFAPGGANQVAPGRRPLSSMAPTFVFAPNGALYAVLGSPGGSRIINYVANTLVALIDWKLTPGEAVAMPHFGSRNGPTELEAGREPAGWTEALHVRGHWIRHAEMNSGLHLVVRTGDGWIGAADPRREGVAGGR